MRVIVPVSDKYQYIIPVFCKLFNKYWDNQECIFLFFKKNDFKFPDNFIVKYIGEDTQYWTNNIRKFLENYDEEYFVLHLEDHFLTDYVKKDRLQIMENEIVNGADKAMLHSHLNIYAEPISDDILLINQEAEYRTSIHTAIWKTEYFLKNLISNTSVWGFETNPNSKNDGAKIVTYKSINTYQDHIVDFMNFLRAGKIDPSITGLWHEEDINTLLEVPLDEESKSILIRRTNNNCTICGKKIDRILIKSKQQMRTFEQYGICSFCQ